MADEPVWFNYEGSTSLDRLHLVRRIRSGGFRSGHLNMVGWAAVLMPGLALGLIVAWASGRSFPLLGLTGVSVTWVVALGLDWIAWRKITFGISRSALSVDQASAVVSRLREQGITVDLRLPRSDDDGSPPWTIRSVNRYRRVVERAIDAAHGGR